MFATTRHGSCSPAAVRPRRPTMSWREFRHVREEVVSFAKKGNYARSSLRWYGNCEERETNSLPGQLHRDRRSSSELPWVNDDRTALPSRVATCKPACTRDADSRWPAAVCSYICSGRVVQPSLRTSLSQGFSLCQPCECHTSSLAGRCPACVPLAGPWVEGIGGRPADQGRHRLILRRAESPTRRLTSWQQTQTSRRSKTTRTDSLRPMAMHYQKRLLCQDG